jgi:hypothetical protein
MQHMPRRVKRGGGDRLAQKHRQDEERTPSNAPKPKPMEPVRGGYARANPIPASTPADWNVWAYMSSGQLWEAVALAHNTEPKTLPVDWTNKDPFADCAPEIQRDMQLARNHAENGKLPCTDKRSFNSARYTLDLPDFAEWAPSIGCEPPPKFPRKVPSPAPSETEVASDAVDQLRPASMPKIDEAISAVYDEAEARGKKSPNLAELVAPVKLKLQEQGLRASKELIQDTGRDAKHASRRGQIGVTMKSKKV